MFERYAIDSSKRFGEGGYGATFAAKDRKSGENLVVKVVDTRKMKLGLIVKECEFMDTCRGHENIIGLKNHGIGQGKHGHLYFIFMERAAGGELFDQLTTHNGAVPEALVRGFMLQLLAGVEHCHKRGVAHRDLKLENVLLDESGVVKVIDFGLSHQYGFDAAGTVDRSMPIEGFCGSKSYAAPEVLVGRGYDGFVADMWSLGVCMFGLLNGFFPVDEAKMTDWRFEKLAKAQRARKSSVATILSWYKKDTRHLSPESVDLLDRLLLVEPAQRATMEDTLSHPWVTGQKAPTPDYYDDDQLRFRGGIGGMGQSEPFDMEIMDDAPVYRSLGGAMESDLDDGMPPAELPGMCRQDAFGGERSAIALDFDF